MLIFKNTYMKLNRILAVALSVGLLGGCSKFDDDYLHNPDPNVNTTANTSYLFTNALVRSSLRGNANSVNGDLLTVGYQEAAFFVQYFGQSVYPDDQLYANTFGEWSSYYSGPLNDLTTIIRYNTGDLKTVAAANGSNNNQLASARIWKAYLFSIVTDRWGDVPYFEAFNPADLTPRYDLQKDIYYDLFKELKEAIAQFDGGAAFKGDILFNGDATKWRKFANSLRMVLALRLSKVDATKGRAEFAEAMAATGGYITTNTDNVSFPYTTDLNYRNPWNNNYVNGEPFGLTIQFVDLLKNNNDPRLPVYAQPATGTTYQGIPYGLDAGAIATWTAANSYSRMGTSFYQSNSPGYIITAAQIMLTRAEAVSLGWVTGDTKMDYDSAISLSLRRNGITSTTVIATYRNQPTIVLNPTNAADARTKIALQKYIALYPNGIEAFNEWRRTGVPALTPAPAALNDSKQIPRRWGYPLDEATLNAANFNEAVARLGGTNSLDARVWWDRP